MRFSKSMEDKAIVVYAQYLDDDGYDRFHPLYNFGLDQGAAVIFQLEIAPTLSFDKVKRIARKYDKTNVMNTSQLFNIFGR